MSLEPTDAETIEAAMRAKLLQVWTCTIGRVENYDPDKKVADVTPVMRNPYNIGDDQVDFEALPTIPNVPVMWPYCGGGWFIHAPMQKGDHVGLVFTHDDVSPWRSTGQISEPDDLRRHALDGCIAIPNVVSALMPFLPDPIAAAARRAGIVIGKDGSNAQIQFTSSGITFGPNPLAVSPIALSVPLLAYVAAAAAAASAGGAVDAGGSAAFAAIASALTAIGLALVPPTPTSPATPAITAAVTACGAVAAEATASVAAAAASAASAATAATAVPSTLVRSI